MTVVFAFSQKATKVSGKYVFYPPSTMSIDEAKSEAIKRARLQALADAFGTIISQTSNTVMTNNGGESSVDFFSSGVNEVMGEWIEDSEEPKVTIEYIDDTLVVTATVKGKGRPLSKTLIPIMAKVLRNSTDENNESDSFLNGDSMFLSFQTPVNGYLIVYLIDHATDQVFCLLPYASSSLPSYQVDQDKRYVFFTDKKPYATVEEGVDEYVLTCSGRSTEYNEIVILFSTSNLIKGNTTRHSLNLPRQMAYKDFSDWLIKLKNSDSNIQTIYKPITVKPT